MKSDFVVFNGVDGSTGKYLRAPVPFAELAGRFNPRREEQRRPSPVLAPIAGVDPRDLAQSGWGVIFAPEVPSEAREALRPLLEHRRSQATRRHEGFYRECDYHHGETSAAFLARHGRGPGPADPEKVPYYLLLVGSPEEIPFNFQYQLDVQYAVGRLWFETPEEYAHYAEAVIATERRPAPSSRQAVFFGPRNLGDPLTRMSACQLVAPLAKRASKNWGMAGWKVTTWLGKRASKERLAQILRGGDTEEIPSLLFTAGHGVGFRETDPRQLEFQGALLCSDWPGPRAETISAAHFFSARDVAADARLQGLISFHFACYSAGTPRWDSFAHLQGDEPRTIASRAFVAGLARRLLSQGALAVIGHIDQVWPCSFLWEGTEDQLQVFDSTLSHLMSGYPVGAAMEYFGQRYGEIAAELTQRLKPAPDSEDTDLDLGYLWLASHDARSYIVCGDPAVHLTAPARGEERRP